MGGEGQGGAKRGKAYHRIQLRDSEGIPGRKISQHKNTEKCCLTPWFSILATLEFT